MADSTMPSPETEISAQEYERIARLIESDESPVGIDAKKTHVIILHMLEEMAARLRRIEDRLGP